MIRGALLALALALACLAASGPARARDLYESEDGEYRLSLRSALKGTWLLSVPADDPMLVEAVGGGAFFRLRFELDARLSRHFSAQVAYEHRALASSGTGLGAGLLPQTSEPPFRLAPVEAVIVDAAPAFQHRHELDRALVALHLPFLELTVGRQALGLGRGLLFSAIDVFAPFAPNEVDREWRRGVDAVHAELRVPELSVLSADVYAIFGRVDDAGLRSFSLLGRIRALVGELDAEVIAGSRDGEAMAGGSISANVGDAELHGELAVFGTDGAGIDGGFLGTRGVVAKGLVGGSYTIDVWRGVRVALEYHYSGFGIEDVRADPSILFDARFQSRLLRGDSQLLGRHALALVLSSELSDEVSGAVSWLQSPVDGSGIVSTSFTWTQSDNLTLVLNALVPWGTPPSGGVPRSEWGSAPITVLLQARLYD
jgi:hypothetical protein